MQFDGQTMMPVSGLTTSSRANGRAWKQMSGVQGVTMSRLPPARHNQQAGARAPGTGKAGVAGPSQVRLALVYVTL